MEHETGERARPNRLTIGKLLGAAGCFSFLFAAALYVESLGSWVLWFVVIPIVAGIYGTYRHGLAGFMEYAAYGALVVPLCLAASIVVFIWLFFLSIIF